MLTRVEDRLNLFYGKDFRPQPRLCECDRAPPLGCVFGHMMQERLVRRCRPAAPARRGHGDQQPRQLDTVAGMKPTERRQRRELTIHAGRRTVMRDRRQHRDRPVTSLRRQPQPRHEPRDILQRHRPPITAATSQIQEPVLQIMGVSLDRVRRLLDRRQLRQKPLHRWDRQLIITEHRPRLELGLRHDNTLHPQLAPPAIPLP
jgi:hypothetical protein